MGSLLRDAYDAAAARLEGVVEATEAGAPVDMTYVPATVAGTDLDGPELAQRIGAFTDGQVEGEGARLTAGYDPLPYEELKAGLQRVANGAALLWFLAGYEARRLQEREP